VKQSPLYAREETWTEFEDKLDMELTPNLREERIRDDELREIHDIVLGVAIEHLDEFPEKVEGEASRVVVQRLVANPGAAFVLLLQLFDSVDLNPIVLSIKNTTTSSIYSETALFQFSTSAESVR